MAKTARLFLPGPSFNQGQWAAGLRARLKTMRLIPGPPAWVPRYRIWRGTGHQWVQFEREDWSGPFFWSGKPSCRSRDDRLFVGYYVERGLASCPTPEFTLSPGWHWHGFYRCLTEDHLRTELDALILSLPERRRVIWLHGSRVEEHGRETVARYQHVLPYTGREVLDEARAVIDRTPPDQWINVMVASVFTLAECSDRQDDVVLEFRNPIVRANEIRHLVEASAQS